MKIIFILLISLWAGDLNAIADDLKLISQVPQRVADAKKRGHKGWDTGITPKMKEASYRYNDELVGIIRDLVKKYYRSGWIKSEEIDAYVKDLYNVRNFEKNILNPSGEFQGTASALEVPGEVGFALETTICNMVERIAARDPKFDFKKWKTQWEQSVKTGD